jgi:hypothetical protein
MTNFKEKLAQFPSGTHFRMVTTKAMQEAHHAEVEEAQRIASTNGDSIEILPQR